MSLGAAQFVVDLVMIDNIVTVLAPRGRLQVRRAIDVRNAEGMKIIGNGCSGVETEARVQLQPVSRNGNSRHNAQDVQCK